MAIKYEIVALQSAPSSLNWGNGVTFCYHRWYTVKYIYLPVSYARILVPKLWIWLRYLLATGTDIRENYTIT